MQPLSTALDSEPLTNYSSPYILWLPWCLSGEESVGLGLIPGLGGSHGEGMATHPSILAWSRILLLDRGALWAAVHGVTESQT